MTWIAILLSIGFVLLCLLIMVVVLLQPGQSEGLAGTFGSGGMLGSAFGVHMKNRLARLTTVLVIVFFLMIFAFNMLLSRKSTSLGDILEQGSVPAPVTESDTVAPALEAQPGDEQTIDLTTAAPVTPVAPPAAEPAPADEQPAAAPAAPQD